MQELFERKIIFLLRSAYIGKGERKIAVLFVRIVHKSDNTSIYFMRKATAQKQKCKEMLISATKCFTIGLRVGRGGLLAEPIKTI